MSDSESDSSSPPFYMSEPMETGGATRAKKAPRNIKTPQNKFVNPSQCSLPQRRFFKKRGGKDFKDTQFCFTVGTLDKVISYVLSDKPSLYKTRTEKIKRITDTLGDDASNWPIEITTLFKSEIARKVAAQLKSELKPVIYQKKQLGPNGEITPEIASQTLEDIKTSSCRGIVHDEVQTPAVISLGVLCEPGGACSVGADGVSEMSKAETKSLLAETGKLVLKGLKNPDVKSFSVVVEWMYYKPVSHRFAAAAIVIKKRHGRIHLFPTYFDPFTKSSLPSACRKDIIEKCDQIVSEGQRDWLKPIKRVSKMFDKPPQDYLGASGSWCLAYLFHVAKQRKQRMATMLQTFKDAWETDKVNELTAQIYHKVGHISKDGNVIMGHKRKFRTGKTGKRGPRDPSQPKKPKPAARDPSQPRKPRAKKSRKGGDVSEAAEAIVSQQTNQSVALAQDAIAVAKIVQKDPEATFAEKQEANKEAAQVLVDVNAPEAVLVAMASKSDQQVNIPSLPDKIQEEIVKLVDAGKAPEVSQMADDVDLNVADEEEARETIAQVAAATETPVQFSDVSASESREIVQKGKMYMDKHPSIKKKSKAKQRRSVAEVDKNVKQVIQGSGGTGAASSRVKIKRSFKLLADIKAKAKKLKQSRR